MSRGTGLAVCGEVDGSFINSHSRQTFLSVTRGTHTVGFDLFLANAAANSDVYDVQYLVLTP